MSQVIACYPCTCGVVCITNNSINHKVTINIIIIIWYVVNRFSHTCILIITDTEDELHTVCYFLFLSVLFNVSTLLLGHCLQGDYLSYKIMTTLFYCSFVTWYWTLQSNVKRKHWDVTRKVRTNRQPLVNQRGAQLKNNISSLQIIAVQVIYISSPYV